MSVTDFECAIAKSQIARYIAGENLNPEVSRQLETHISECPRCKQLLMEKKSSLEAKLRSTIETVEVPVAMTSTPTPESTRPAPIQATGEPKEMTSEPATPKASLLGKLLAKQDENVIEVPQVAPAFAHKDAPKVAATTIHLDPSDAPAKKTKKAKAPKAAKAEKKSLFKSLALFERVPNAPEGVKPAMTADNLREAKKALKQNRPGLNKPILYLCGVCAAAAAMSFVVKDPTSLLGGKANQDNLLVKDRPKTDTPKETKSPKVGESTAKRLDGDASKQAIRAEGFVDPATGRIEPQKPTAPAKATPSKPKPAAKPTAAKPANAKPVAKKPVTAKKPAVAKTTVAKKPVAKKPTAKKPVLHTTKKSTVRRSTRRHTTTAPKTSKESVVHVYAPDGTPTNNGQ
ncbi:MAG: zf-HC2 domain-containing protein [Armatimonadetes bacterium]|nr:zf-HC2 domain-containing protein [Armatimonadota bacterium]